MLSYLAVAIIEIVCQGHWYVKVIWKWRSSIGHGHMAAKIRVRSFTHPEGQEYDTFYVDL